uniref:Uncharacterized protein n=1 Tax=Plectus sambesii TaxID=2011161 RepID=A0A914V551_9BILA
MSLVAALSRCLFLLFVFDVRADEKGAKFTPQEMDEISLILERGSVNDPRNLTAIEQLFSHLLVEELSDPAIRKDLVPIEHHLAIVKKMERLGRMLRDSFEYNENEGKKGEEYMRYFKEQGERRLADKHSNGAADRRALAANSFLLSSVLIMIAADCNYFFDFH